MTKSHQLWSSNYAFLMAAVGSAVGLANIWKFPYTVGTAGGGAFILVYLVAIFLVAVPVLIAELAIGRAGKAGPAASIARVAEASGANRGWRYIASFGILASVLTLGFYLVIAGWTLFYTVESLRGGFIGAGAEEFGRLYDQLIGSPGTLIASMIGFSVIAAVPVLLDIHNGIERCVKYLMPTFFLILLFNCSIAVYYGDLDATIDFLFNVNFDALSAETVIYAVGQAFFSVGVGACVLIVFGAHLSEKVSIPRYAVLIAGADTAVALIAGLTVFPIVFANGIDPGEGPGLLFVSMPTALAQFEYGGLIAALFFLMLLIAALTSAIAIALPPIEWLKYRFGMRHARATLLVFLVELALGVTVALSFNRWESFYPLGFVSMFDGLTFFGLYEMFAANILMPMGGIMVSLFIGWWISPEILARELRARTALSLMAWRLIFRFVVPLSLASVALFGLLE